MPIFSLQLHNVIVISLSQLFVTLCPAPAAEEVSLAWPGTVTSLVTRSPHLRRNLRSWSGPRHWSRGHNSLIRLPDYMIHSVRILLSVCYYHSSGSQLTRTTAVCFNVLYSPSFIVKLMRSFLSFHSFIVLPFSHQCLSLWSPRSIPFVTKGFPFGHQGSTSPFTFF